MPENRPAPRRRSMALALAVNLVGNLCSAGLPAAYSALPAQAAIPAWQHHLYLLL